MLFPAADEIIASSSKLSLSTGSAATTNNTNTNNEHPTRNYTLSKRFGGDSSSHGTKNPFNAISPSTAIPSPTAAASSAFSLGSGAFASFGSSRGTPKSAGSTLDFGSVVLGPKTPSTEKSFKDAALTKTIGPKASRTSLTTAKTATPPPVHTLRQSWVFWFRPPISKSNGYLEYEKTLHAIAGFDTVEDFFAIYKHLKRPSSLPMVSDYHIFKKGIRPVWEDEENKKGGKWIVRLKKGVADRYWEDLVFAIVGDQFAEASEEVCGAVLSVRNGEDILSIWARNDGGRVLKIRETMKRVLAFPPDTKVEWKSHDSSIQQRTAIDESRKEKGSNNVTHTSSDRRHGKDEHQGDRKLAS
ncbi:MAG: hypothetical protein M1818_008422 [Claussenomyces sp. TS43310]|nr:MAG: hypothetical protein M1818_008422 [Claussenomyces sp. TS43310]